jgi:glycosyltransferase involved in cell wall biosynthesis
VLSDIVAEAREVGLQRVHLLAWRDLDDPEAGGSELHAHRIASRWAQCGLDVTMSASAAPGIPRHGWRDGYRVIRRAGRYGVFPRTAFDEVLGRNGRADGIVEIWNGMPFFAPVWSNSPLVVFLHHVHAEMWRTALPPRLAALGDLVERRLAPPLYRRSRVVTLSASSRDEIVSQLGLRKDRVSVVPPGVDDRFSPGGERSPEPFVIAVGRLVPVKRFDLLIDQLVEVRQDLPTLRAVIVGEGYERRRLEALVHAAGAESWLTLPGRVEDRELVDLYRRAWVVASASSREGWGMTITEAASCGTPAVATRIAGHRDAVLDKKSGVLVDHPGDLAVALSGLLRDEVRRARLREGGLARARDLTWDATATGTLHALVDEARSSVSRRSGAIRLRR